MTSDEHAQSATEPPAAAAPAAPAPAAASPAAAPAAARPKGWRGWFSSPLRAALVAVAATLVLVAGPCALGGFVLGTAVGSAGWGNGDDGPRMERRDYGPGPDGQRPGGFDRRNDRGRMPPPAPITPSSPAIPAPSATS
jgi:hypothetical protein